MKDCQEIFKSIKGYEGHYSISNYGKVKSHARITEYTREDGTFSRITVRERILKPKTDKDGYKEVRLSKDRKSKHMRVHRLVGIYFVEGYREDLVIDHIDNVKDNNHYKNLQWVTATYNTIKYYRDDYTDTRILANMTKYDWLYAKFLNWNGISYAGIAENLGVSPKSLSTIGEGLSGRRFSSITGFTESDRKPDNTICQVLTDEQVMSLIIDRCENKLPLKVIAEKYGVAESMVSRMSRGLKRHEVYLRYLNSKV